jgi:hypothetical protein
MLDAFDLILGGFGRSWRPMPGRNSKEDAATVSKESLKAEPFEELKQSIQRQNRKRR